MTNVAELRKKNGDDIVKWYSVAWADDGEWALRELLAGRRYRTVIETGTFCGVSACILADYADHVHTFDIAEQPAAQAVIDSAGYNDKVTRYVCDNARKVETIRKLIANGDVDLAFIDGDHEGDGPMLDILACAGVPLLIIDNYQPGYAAVIEAADSVKCKTKVACQNIVRLEPDYA